MKKSSILLAAFACIVAVSCNKDDENGGGSSIVGEWSGVRGIEDKVNSLEWLWDRGNGYKNAYDERGCRFVNDDWEKPEKEREVYNDPIAQFRKKNPDESDYSEKFKIDSDGNLTFETISGAVAAPVVKLQHSSLELLVLLKESRSLPNPGPVHLDFRPIVPKRSSCRDNQLLHLRTAFLKSHYVRFNLEMPAAMKLAPPGSPHHLLHRQDGHPHMRPRLYNRMPVSSHITSGFSWYHRWYHGPY